MKRLFSLTRRSVLIVLHDIVATAAAIVATFGVRFDEAQFAQRLPALKFLPLFLVYAAAVYFVFNLHRNKWRFTSLPDLTNIVRASTVLALSLLVLDYILLAPNVYGQFFFGKVTILLYWLLQMFVLAGSRVVYRYFHYTRAIQRVRVADAAVLLRGIDSGAVHRIWPIGVLSPSPAVRGQSIRGIPVLGEIDDLERIAVDFEARGTRIIRLVLTPSALVPEARPEAVLVRARRLGLTVSKLPALDSAGAAVELAPVAVEDLLLRPSVDIDYQRLEQFVAGRSVVVTGGGGSIGAEICERIVTFGAARLLVIER